MDTVNTIAKYQYDPVNDVYRYGDNVYIENNYGRKSTFIDISSDMWSIDHRGITHSIEWHTKPLAFEITEALKIYAISKLKVSAPSYINRVRQLYTAMSDFFETNVNSFKDVSSHDIVMFWQDLNHDQRSTFRELYKWLAYRGHCGAKKHVYAEIKSWNARKETGTLKFVTEWHATKGAYTLTEWDALKKTVQIPFNELAIEEQSDPVKLMARAFIWLSMLCGKRPSQILSMKNEQPVRVGNEWIVHVKPVKHQAGRGLVSVIITDGDLIELINRISERREISEWQNNFDRLWAFEDQGLLKHGVLSVWKMNLLITSWWRNHSFKSDRTKDKLILNSYRIRHTFATTLAMNNTPREVIQELMEHDSIESASAYINACACRLSKELNKVDLNNDNIFTKLNNAYFEGVIEDSVSEDEAIFVPDEKPSKLIVGACKRNTCEEGLCDKHPFIGCYGCNSFRPWRNGVHEIALNYVRSERKKIQSVNEGKRSDRDISILDNAEKYMMFVIEKIEQEAKNNDKQ